MLRATPWWWYTVTEDNLNKSTSSSPSTTLRGEAPSGQQDSYTVPFSQLETQCPYTLSLLSRSHGLPDCLVDMMRLSLHRGNPRSPCVGIDGYFDRGDVTLLSLLWKHRRARKLGETVGVLCQEHCCPLRGEHERPVSTCCPHCGLSHRETEWGSVQLRQGKSIVALDESVTAH